MKLVALDVETTGLTWNDKLLGVGAAWTAEGAEGTRYWSVGQADLFSERSSIPELAVALHDLLKDADWVACHNASFDLPWLLRGGVLSSAQVEGRLADTLLLARSTAGHASVSLLNLAKEFHLSQGEAWERAKHGRAHLQDQPVAEVAEYCQQDCLVTLGLLRRVLPAALQLYGEEWLRRDGNFPLLIAEMRCVGQQLDTAWIARRAQEGHARAAELTLAVLAPAGLRGPNDRSGILAFLRSQGVSEEAFTRTGRGAASVDADSLQVLRTRLPAAALPVIDAVLECRQLEKQRTTWLDGLLQYADEDGRVHGGFTAGGAVSFRLTCDNPNLQAVPKEMHVIGPGRGQQAVLSLDYSQAELRLAAMYAGENRMAEAFARPGADIHLATAEAMFGAADAKARRSDAKRCNFGAIYGGGARAIAEAVGVDEQAARKLIESHKQAYPRLYSVAKEAERAWLERGYLVLCTGRRLYASPEDLATRPYKAFNQLVQGSVAEMVKLAMLQMRDQGLRIIGQVHDSIQIEVATGADLASTTQTARSIMEGALPERVRRLVQPPIPMLVDVDVCTAEGG